MGGGAPGEAGDVAEGDAEDDVPNAGIGEARLDVLSCESGGVV